MVTLQTIGGRYSRNILELYGLSTDDKPLDTCEGMAIANGSTFYCMDTKKVYIFDEANKQWLEQ